MELDEYLLPLDIGVIEPVLAPDPTPAQYPS
jgi:hypothetical protein